MELYDKYFRCMEVNPGYQFEISQLPIVSILISFYGLFFIFPSSDIGFVRLGVEIK